ncbi:MAG: folate family ECF transporter S component [Candidatus Atribacteria bacterium]|nr:folate family ECF transporter S component [Candidatus Atribacteria bacterium]
MFDGKTMRAKTRSVVLQGLLIALGVILTRFASIRVSIGGIEGIRIGVGTLPIMMAGILMGPLSGSLVGCLVDIIGYALNPMGPYMPHFTLTAALYGFIPGVIFSPFLSSRWEKVFPPRTLLWFTVLLTQLSIGLFLTPVFLNAIFHIPWKILLIPRLVSIPIQIILCYYLLDLLFKTPSLSTLFRPADTMRQNVFPHHPSRGGWFSRLPPSEERVKKSPVLKRRL